MYFKVLEDATNEEQLVLEGYLALFGGKDLTGETFTPDTRFDSSYTRSNHVLVDWEHGMEPDGVKNQPGRDDILGTVDYLTARKDDIGLLARHVLDRREMYVKEFIEPLARAGLLGSSSEATPKAIIRKDGIIEQWPLKRQSFTVNPAEPRLLTEKQMQVMKSLGFKSPSKDAKDGVDSDSEPTNGDIKMSEENENKPDVDAQKAVNTRFEKVESAIGELTDSVKTVVEALEKIPAKTTDVVVIEDETDKAVKNHPYKMGEFLHAVKAVASHQEPTKVQKAILGENESVPSEGGYLVGTEQDGGLAKKMHETSVFLNRIENRTISQGANSVDFYGISENSRANGSRFGGVRGYRVGEGQPITASQMRFYKYTLKPSKYAALVYATDELLQDSRLAQQEIQSAVPQELAFMQDNDIFNGVSAGYAEGILGHTSLVTVAKDAGQTAATITEANILNMWSRLWSGSKSNAVWFVNQDTAPQLHQLEIGSGGSLLYRLPGMNGNEAPFGTLMGRPVIETEFNETLGTVGDIVLADMSQYKGATIGTVQSASSIHVQFLTDQTVFRFTVRFDGQPTWESALTPYKGSNTQSPFVALATRA